jgi:hypothetical protein
MKPEDQQDLNFGGEKDRVIRRIQKMLRLANDAGASEGERDNALRMVHATLAKYNLTLAGVEGAGGSGQEERRGEHTFDMVGHAWARTVVNGISKLMFCEYFYVRLDQRFIRNYVIGRESNAITAIEMARYVTKNIEAEAGRKTREFRADGKFHRDFCKGAASRIYVRCERLRAEAEKESAAAPVDQLRANGTAIVLASVYQVEQEANKDYIQKHHGKLKEGVNRQTRPSHIAYALGAAHGDKVQLTRQVGADKATDQRRIK